MINRCAWVPLHDELYIKYHDEEWGLPVHNDRLLFEFLILEGFQAGLSWRTVLYKRENFRQAFDQFEPKKMALYDEQKIAELLGNPKIIRNRSKILASIANARAFLEIQAEYGSFDRFIWQFVDGKPRQNRWESQNQLPASTPESEALSKELTRRGFRFVGSTICYAHMQATGMVNDHTRECFRFSELCGD